MYTQPNKINIYSKYIHPRLYVNGSFGNIISETFGQYLPVQCSTVLGTGKYSTAQHCTILNCTVLYSTLQYCKILHSAVQYSPYMSHQGI